MIIVNSVFPVFILIIVGIVLKRINFTNDIFLKISDKLVYFILWPAMLFWKIGSQSISNGTDLSIAYATVGATILMFVLSTLFIIFYKVNDYDAGTFSQSCYRFNTYIGIAVILNSVGEEGLIPLGLIITFVIPIVNFFSVSILIWHSGERYSPQKQFKITFQSIIKNPLILACASGLIFAMSGLEFPTFMHNSFSLISSAALPLALISIGASFSIGKFRDYLSLSIYSSIFKLLIFPIIGLLSLHLFNVTGLSFKVGMIFFALPTSTAIYALSSQLNSNTNLASSTIVVSTAFSLISLSLVLLFI